MEINNIYEQVFGPCLAFILAIFCFIQDYSFRKKSKISKSWPNVSGEILSSEIDEKTSSYDDQSSTCYTVKIIYTYNIDGTEYTGSKISFGPPVSFNSLKKNFIQSFRNIPKVVKHMCMLIPMIILFQF